MRQHVARQRRARTVGVAGLGVLILPLAALPATAAVEPEEQSPRNVIVVVGDGMGYNHVDLASMYEQGTSNYQVAVDPAAGTIEHVEGTPTQVYEHFPVQYAMSTHSVGGEYDPEVMWGDFTGSVEAAATDSAASATAMASGVKTVNQAVGVGPDGEEVPNVVERAQQLGKATGVVTSVVFPHPTTASFAVHHESRLEYLEIADLLVHESGLDVIMGTGHPWYSDNGDRYEAPDYNYISEETWTALSDGETPFELIEERADFQQLMTAEQPPSRVMGVAQAWTTLQEARGDGESEAPFTDPFIDTVPDLSEMTLGALNVLDNASQDGFFLAVESGAIDWSSELHAPARVVEEQIALNEAVAAAVGWVEENSSWEETMIVVTSDHEAGYVFGPGSDPAWTPMVPAGIGQLPEHSWHRLGHSNHLVPLYANGAGSQAFAARATGTDPVRGAYLDNTDVGQVILDELWALPPTDPPTEDPTDPPTEDPTDPPTEDPTDPPTGEPTDPPTDGATEQPEPTPSGTDTPGPGAGDDGAGSGGEAGDGEHGGGLPATGAPVGALLVAALGLLGTGLTAALWRRRQHA